MSIEERLRGALVALVAFGVATSVSSGLVRHPGPAIELVQISHAAAGVITVLAGAAYLLVHLRATLGGIRAAIARTPRGPALTAVVLVGLTAGGLGVLNSGLEVSLVVLQAVYLVLIGLWIAMLLLLLRALLRLRRHGSAYVFGGLALFAGFIAALSGLEVLLGASRYSTGLTSFWFMHVVTSPLALALTAGHVLASRRRAAQRGESGGRSYAWRRPTLRVALPLGVALLVASGALVTIGSSRLEQPVADESALVPAAAGFTEQVHGACSSCHAEVVDDWRGSSHRLAANNPFFTGLLEELWEARGPSGVRVCLRCHAPHARDPLRSGSLREVVASEGYGAGVHCVSCHRAAPGRHAMDGLVEILPTARGPHIPIWERIEGRGKGEKFLANVLALSRIGDHRGRWGSPPAGPSTCRPCHVQTLGPPTGGRLETVLQDQHASWKRSAYGTAAVTCTHCHAPRYVNREDYPVMDHRFLGASTYLAGLVDPERVQVVTEHLRGRMPLAGPRLRDEEAPFEEGERPWSGAPLLRLEVSLERGEATDRLLVETRSRGIGHSFPNGPTDLLQVWLALRVEDAGGELLLDLGADGPDPRTRLGHVLRDASGRRIDDHGLWAVATVEDRGAIQVNETHEMRVPLERRVRAPVTVEAAWKYRRLDPDLVERVTGHRPALPVVEMARFSGSVE